MASFLAIFYFGEVLYYKDLLINEEIRAKDVRLIDSEGNQMGVITYFRELSVANKKKLDDLIKYFHNAKSTGLQNFRLWKV